MENSEIQLIAEQMRHYQSKITARMDALETAQEHQKEINQAKFEHQGSKITDLEEDKRDHEARIRILNDATQKLVTSQSIGSAILAVFTLVASAIAAWLGSR